MTIDLTQQVAAGVSELYVLGYSYAVYQSTLPSLYQEQCRAVDAMPCAKRTDISGISKRVDSRHRATIPEQPLNWTVLLDKHCGPLVLHDMGC